MPEFDIVIPIAKNDIIALISSLPYIRRMAKGNQIIVIANHIIKDEIDNIEGVKFIDEDLMLDGLNFFEVKKWIKSRYPKAVRRTGWYFQQFLKLGYALKCEKDYYLSWDSDTLPLRELDFFTDSGIPYLDYKTYEKRDRSYENTIKNLWSNGSVCKKKNKSFITEHMMFSSALVREMIQELEANSLIKGSIFAEKIINAIKKEYLNLSGFSEFETYAAYVLCRDEGSYVMRRWNNLRHGKAYFGASPSKEQLQWASEEFDVVSIEDFDKQLGISKALCSENAIKRMKFHSVYRIIEPIINLKYAVRMLLRSIIRK